MFITKVIRKIINRINSDPYKVVKAMQERGVKVGQNVRIYSSNIDYNKYYRLLEIGDNVTISHSTILLHDASTKLFMNHSKIGAVKIGNNVFVGYGSIILPGTAIGDNVVIGAGTVVRGDIPDDSVVIGNPCRIVCKTSDYINKNKNALNDSTYYDIHNPADIERMNPLTKKGFI